MRIARIAPLLTLATLLFLGSVGCARDTIFALAVHPTKPQIVYVSTKTGVFKTRDGGKTWSPMPQGLEGAQVISLAIDPVLSSTIYAGTFATAVYKSADGGQRWQPANLGLKGHVSVVYDLAIDPKDTRIVYLATTIGPYRSMNAGGNWTEIVHGMESVYTATLAIDPENSTTLYAGTSGGMYKSTDRGNRWEIINKGLIEGDVDTAMALGINTVAVDPLNTETVYIGSTQGIYATTDGGAKWSRRMEGLTTKFVAKLLIDPGNPATLYAGTDKGVFKSTDSASTWDPSNEGLTHRVVRSMSLDPSDPSTIYVGTQGGLFRSRDGAATWVMLPLKRAS